MSFGFSPTDIVTLVQLTTRTYKGWKNACGEYGEITSTLFSFQVVLGRVQRHVKSPNESNIGSALGVDGALRDDLQTVLLGSEKTIGELRTIVKKYPSMSTDQKSNWDRIRFGCKNLDSLQIRLSRDLNLISTMLLDVVLQSVDLCRQDINQVSNTLKGGIPVALEDLIEKKAADTKSASTAWTTYEHDSKEVWRELRGEMIKLGFKSDDIRANKEALLDLAKSIAGGSHDAEMSEQTDAPFEDAPGSPMLDGLADEGREGESRDQSQDSNNSTRPALRRVWRKVSKTMPTDEKYHNNDDARKISGKLRKHSRSNIKPRHSSPNLTRDPSADSNTRLRHKSQDGSSSETFQPSPIRSQSPTLGATSGRPNKSPASREHLAPPDHRSVREDHPETYSHYQKSRSRRRSPEPRVGGARSPFRYEEPQKPQQSQNAETSRKERYNSRANAQADVNSYMRTVRDEEKPRPSSRRKHGGNNPFSATTNPKHVHQLFLEYRPIYPRIESPLLVHLCLPLGWKVHLDLQTLRVSFQDVFARDDEPSLLSLPPVVCSDKDMHVPGWLTMRTEQGRLSWIPSKDSLPDTGHKTRYVHPSAPDAQPLNRLLTSDWCDTYQETKHSYEDAKGCFRVGGSFFTNFEFDRPCQVLEWTVEMDNANPNLLAQLRYWAGISQK